MLTPEERDLLIEVYDVLVKTYTLRQEENIQGIWNDQMLCKWRLTELKRNERKSVAGIPVGTA